MLKEPLSKEMIHEIAMSESPHETPAQRKLGAVIESHELLRQENERLSRARLKSNAKIVKGNVNTLPKTPRPSNCIKPQR